MFSLRLSRSLSLARYTLGRRLLSDVPSSLPIASKTKGWPTPWITEADATEYLFPLYLQGWYVAAVPTVHPLVKAAGLACRFSFPSSDPAANTFVKDVLALTETENHHPHVLKLTTSPKNSVVQITTTTHSAIRPEWDPTDTPDSRTLEGITLRDLRFAALISALPSGPGTPTAEIGPSPTRPLWEDLCTTLRLWATPALRVNSKPAADGAKPPKPPVCAACEGAHPISACPTRHNIPAPPCTICRGVHWRVDCPVRKQSQRHNVSVGVQRQSKRTSTDGGAERGRPPSPCPNCGGPHWKVDCRVPQAPPDLLERLKLPVPEPQSSTTGKAD